MNWLTRWRINRLLVKRAGVVARHELYKFNLDNLTTHGIHAFTDQLVQLARLDEKLRQLGYAT